MEVGEIGNDDILQIAPHSFKTLVSSTLTLTMAPGDGIGSQLGRGFEVRTHILFY